MTYPTINDTDGDTIPDGFETETGCLNPLVHYSRVVNFIGEVVNRAGKEFDNDGMTNVEEFNQKTSPVLHRKNSKLI